MKSFFLYRLTILGCLVLLLVSCSVHQVKQEIQPPTQIPKDYSYTGAMKLPDNRWWEAFEAEPLSRLIEQVVSRNLHIKAAWARLDQMAAMAQQSGALLYPQLNFEGRLSRSKTEFSSFGRNATGYSTQIPLSLNLSYEVDLWDRIQSQREAALLDFEANAELLQSTVLLLASQVTGLWINIHGAEAERQLLAEQIETNQTFLELVELRFSQGQASAVDVYQQRQQLAATQAEVPLVESRREVFNQELAVLVNRSPAADFIKPDGNLPALPKLPDLGIPAALLQTRPDIRAAYLRVVAADYRVGSAIADKYPAVRLIGSGSLSGDDISSLFDNWLWSLAGSVAAPMLDGNRRDAAVKQNRAKVKELLYDYGQTVLTAVKEVEIVLTKEEKQQIYLKQLSEQMAIATKELREARARYRNGLSDYLPVLRALQSLQAVERRHLAARTNLLLNRVDLYSALGGAWTQEIERSIPSINANTGSYHDS